MTLVLENNANLGDGSWNVLEVQRRIHLSIYEHNTIFHSPRQIMSDVRQDSWTCPTEDSFEFNAYGSLNSPSAKVDLSVNPMQSDSLISKSPCRAYFSADLLAKLGASNVACSVILNHPPPGPSLHLEADKAGILFPLGFCFIFCCLSSSLFSHLKKDSNEKLFVYGKKDSIRY
ncbi:hypothetical protein VNO77_09813 [Canavalia gladiata]|uniref:Uncharacterized protein n=1 Tax=Canavalia gladiata TaxID=3824 RepID=A0AAN9QXI9_CANGL